MACLVSTLIPTITTLPPNIIFEFVKMNVWVNHNAEISLKILKMIVTSYGFIN